MSEIAFSALALAVLFAVVVPLLTLAGKGVLVARRRLRGILDGLGATADYLLVVGPVLVPAIWFVSAGLHQSEPGWRAGAAGLPHLAGQACYNALVLAGVVAALLAAALVRRHLLVCSEHLPAPDGAAHCRRTERLAAICAGHPTLAHLRRRIVVVPDASDALYTLGALHPTIVLSATLCDALDDQALSSALLHEAAHVRGRDPLRYLLATVCLSLNPLARMLRPELRRWMRARELVCDRAAVHLGAAPLPLARAIVVAARPRGAAPHRAAIALAAGGVRFLHLRIELLLAYSRGAHTLCCWPARPASMLASTAALLAATVLLPHAVNAWPLDHLHPEIEVALASLGLG